MIGTKVQVRGFGPLFGQVKTGTIVKFGKTTVTLQFAAGDKVSFHLTGQDEGYAYHNCSYNWCIDQEILNRLNAGR